MSKKEDKQMKKLHKMHNRLIGLVGEDNANMMINDMIDKGLALGEISSQEAVEFRKELFGDGNRYTED